MKYRVAIITLSGSIEDHTIEADSANAASSSALMSYQGCKVRSVSLISEKPDHVVMYSQGDQVEVPKIAIYVPFEE